MVDTATKLRRAFIAIPKAFYCVLLVLLCIVLADLNGRPRTFNSAETRILKEIFTNANQNPISDIQLLSGSSCNTGYSAVTLGTWPGTVEGCQCGSTITAGPCTSSSCTSIPALSSQHLTKWKSDQFCIKRISSWAYPTIGTLTCASGYTYCPGSSICVSSTDTCPITFMQIQTSVTTVPTGYTQLALTTGSRSLLWSLTEDGSPITDLDVSLFDMPCMDPEAMPYDSTKVPYPLSVYPENGCGGTGLTENLQNLENQALANVYSENSLISISSLPGYSTYIANDKGYFVGIRQYQLINANAKCGTVDPVRFTEAQNDESYFVNHVWPLIVAAIVVMSIKFFTIIIELYLRIRMKIQKIEEEDHWLKLFHVGNLLLLTGACILFFIIGGFGVHAQVSMNTNTSYFKYLALNQCFEQTVVNRIFQVFQGNISNFYAIVWLCISLLIVATSAIILTIIMAMVNYCYGNSIDLRFYRNFHISFGRKRQPKQKRQQTKQVPANIEMLLAR